jgi:hypothetical protein
MNISAPWCARPVGLLALGLALVQSACDDNDLFSPENLGSFAVDLNILNISGTPGQGQFVVDWEDLDSRAAGGAPLNPEFLPKEFS